MKSLQGHFLIAAPQLIDPNFARSVVLLVKHDDEGALGLIVNRPLETTLAEVCEQILEFNCDTADVIFQGGPCEGPMMVLHGDADLSQIHVGKGLEFTTERDHIEALLRQERAPLKCFVGYAGWTAGQLETEIESGSWFSTAADPRHVFDAGHDLWIRLKTQAHLSQWIDPERIPDDPSVN